MGEDVLNLRQSCVEASRRGDKGQKDWVMWLWRSLKKITKTHILLSIHGLNLHKTLIVKPTSQSALHPPKHKCAHIDATACRPSCGWRLDQIPITCGRTRSPQLYDCKNTTLPCDPQSPYDKNQWIQTSESITGICSEIHRETRCQIEVHAF